MKFIRRCFRPLMLALGVYTLATACIEYFFRKDIPVLFLDALALLQIIFALVMLVAVCLLVIDTGQKK